MHTSLRHHLIAPIALCLLAACSSEEPVEQSKGATLEFAVRTEEAVSRANNVTFNQFAVFTEMMGDDSHNTMLIMDNVPVTFDQENDQWVYGVTQYWFPKFEYTFIGVTPNSVLSASNANRKYSNSQLVFTYTMPSDCRQVDDILTATHRRLYEDGTEGNVVMRFHHLLSQINVAPRFDDNEQNDTDVLKFHKFELSGVAKTATFSLTPASLQSSDRTDDWVLDISVYDGTISYTVEFDTPIQLTNHGGSKNLFENGLLMLPQTITPEADCKIILTYSINDDKEPSLLTIPLNNLQLGSGMSSTFNFIFDKMGLKMETFTINPWVEVKNDQLFPIE